MPKIKSDGNKDYQLQQVKAEIDNHNSEIKGDYGSRGISTVSLQKRGKGTATLQLRFSYPVTREGIQDPQQYSIGMGSAFSSMCRNKAYSSSRLVTHALKISRFSSNGIAFWDWLDYDVLKVSKPGEEKHIVGDLIDEYKKHWIKLNSDKSQPEMRYHSLRGYYLDKLPRDVELSGKVIESFLMALPDNQTLKNGIAIIKDLLTYHRLIDAYLSNLNCRKYTGKDTKERKAYTPNDEQIIKVYESGFLLVTKDGRKKQPRHQQSTRFYQFVYGIMATYGIRAHEFFHVLNWHQPVDVSSGEWVTVDSDGNYATEDEYGSSDYQLSDSRTIPAFFDPGSSQPILVIGDDTKTGKRLAVPLSPPGDDWVMRFKLKDGLPECPIEDPSELGRARQSKGSHAIQRYFNNSNHGGIVWDLANVARFTSHKLRHAYTHRGRSIGFDPWKLAQSQGHTLTTAENVYAKNFHGIRTKEMLLSEMERVKHRVMPQITYDQALMRVAAIKAKSENIDDFASQMLAEIYGISPEGATAPSHNHKN